MPMLWKLKELVFLRKHSTFYRRKEKLQQQIKDDVINETEVLHNEDSTEKQVAHSNNKDGNVKDTKFYFINTKNKRSSDTNTSEENKALQSTSLNKELQTLNEVDLQDQEVTPFNPANSEVFAEEAICKNKLESSTALLESCPSFIGDDIKQKNETENLDSPSELPAQIEDEDINHHEKLRSDKLVSSGNTLTNDNILGNNKNYTLINHNIPEEDVGADLTGTKDNEELATITSEENGTIITKATLEPTNMIKNGGLTFSDNILIKDPPHGHNKSHISDTKISEKNKDLQSTSSIKDRQALNKIDLQYQDVTLPELAASIDEEPICEKKSDSSTMLSEFSPLFVGDNTERKNETENLDSPSETPVQTEYQEIKYEEKLKSDGIVIGDKTPTYDTFLGNNKNHTLINHNIPKEDVGADLTGTEDNEEPVSITSEENGTITTRAIPEPTNMIENGGLAFGDNTLVQDAILGDNKNQNVPNKFITKEDMGTDLTETKDMEESVTITNKEKGTTIIIRAITEPTKFGKQTKQSNIKYDDYIIIKDTEEPNNSTRVTNDSLENVQGNRSTEVLTTISRNTAAESIKNESPIESCTDNNFSLSLEQNSNLINEDHLDLPSRSKNPDKQNQDTKNINSSDDRSQQDEIEDIYDIVEITELATQKLDEDSKNVAEITSKNDKAENSLPSSEENTSEVQTFLESLDTDPYNIIDISEIISPPVRPETKET